MPIPRFLECEHFTQQELAAARGEVERSQRDDPELEILARRELEHETEHLERLRSQGLRLVEFAFPDGSLPEDSHARTLAAMGFGDPVFVVPSELVHNHANPQLRGETCSFNFNASLESDANDRWHDYQLSAREVGRHVLSLLRTLPQKLKVSAGEAASFTAHQTFSGSSRRDLR